MLNSFYFTTKLIKNNNTIIQSAKSSRWLKMLFVFILFQLSTISSCFCQNNEIVRKDTFMSIHYRFNCDTIVRIENKYLPNEWENLNELFDIPISEKITKKYIKKGKEWILLKDGNIYESGQFIKVKLSLIYFFRKNTLRQKEGIWIYFDDKGYIIRKEYYENGKLEVVQDNVWNFRNE